MSGTKLRDGVSVTTYPRMHVTLIDMGKDGYRSNGGLGFTINSLSQSMNFVFSHETSLHELNKFGYRRDEISKITVQLECIRIEYKFARTIVIKSCAGIRRHTGLGSGTAIMLACIEALFLANDAAFDNELLQKLSGRGGTSGVGINTYFSGGFIFDIGRKSDELAIESSDSITGFSEIPLVLQQFDMPSWKCGVLIAKKIPTLSEQQESDFFRSVRVTAQSIHTATYHSVLGVVGSAISCDFLSFCRAINALQLTEWKANEIALYGDDVQNRMTTLRALGCDAVGMSSLGPAIFFFSQKMDEIHSLIKSQFPDDIVEISPLRNKGREVTFG